MNAISLFSLLSLFYAWVGLRTLVEAWRDRERLFDATVTRQDRSMLDRLAFFLLIPLGVLLHELGHAAATLQVGGEVLEFRWLLYFGYVLPAGDFSALEHWWIALAGNLVGVLLGLAVLSLLWLPMSPAWTYLTWSFARLQLFYALVFYPVFSSVTGFGDWATIYSREGGRWVWPTVAIHALLLLGYAGLMRYTGFRRWLVDRYAPAGPARPDAVVARDAASAIELNALGAHYAAQGEWRLAERSFREAEHLDPTDPRPLLNRARIHAAQGRHDRARALYQAALELAQAPVLRSWALAGLAEAELEHRRPALAMQHVEAALALSPANPSLLFLRGRLRALTGEREGAQADFAKAMAAGDEALAGAARMELDRLRSEVSRGGPSDD